MCGEMELQEIHSHIQALKRTAEHLTRLAEDFPAVARNAKRVLASVRMLQINVSDLLGEETGGPHPDRMA